MLEAINLAGKKISSFVFKESEQIESLNVANSDGFVTIELSIPKITAVKDEIYEVSYFITVKGYINNDGSDTIDECDDKTELFNFSSEFSLAYHSKYDLGQFQKLHDGNEWYFEKDAHFYMNEYINKFLMDTRFRSIKIPLQP
ncbi:hypothetical protein H5085_04175 [Pseudoalteromonas sp. SR43-6]|jgi:hypothetical protein|uniref:hypothetical protein n=1 Tax=unclassified Pseudoalteromonas TaxID=194690 RepID=UPI0015FDCF4C|nr:MULTISPECIES: hypothetical protein [unclassified Pseudoalteromonas]MBB1289270.1 hypothetical protein [Pseudoalteromonas sp. SR41-5]MBB1373532.1 hypothetical protein [Pseudoalteromonas sp. SR43-6]MBB1411979.1 hypothetical protein [Pseudoalteromonas sp. SG43-8]WMS89735.1 hypothetical protein RB214_10935 [Pseudoalteromonas sp. HL-AS1]